MTWMPDHGSAPRSRRHNSSPRSNHRPDRADDLGYDGVERHQRSTQPQLGIPRILGRRARWVGVRLRRET